MSQNITKTKFYLDLEHPVVLRSRNGDGTNITNNERTDEKTLGMELPSSFLDTWNHNLRDVFVLHKPITLVSNLFEPLHIGISFGTSKPFHTSKIHLHQVVYDHFRVAKSAISEHPYLYKQLLPTPACNVTSHDLNLYINPIISRMSGCFLIVLPTKNISRDHVSNDATNKLMTLEIS